MVKLKNVEKTLGGKTILNNINYEFQYGHIYGLYGKNGSGKTMLIRAIAGLIIPDKGEITIDDKLLHKDITVPPSIGIVIENQEMLPYYNAFDNLKILSKIKKSASEDDINKSLNRVGLDTDLIVKKYSLGMKQRLNIAQAIFESPKIILLDEPTNALDDSGVDLIYQVLREEKSKNSLIIIATHHKEDLNQLCDIVLKISEGKLYEK